MALLNNLTENLRTLSHVAGRLSLCLFALLALPACQSSRGGPIPYANTPLAAPDVPRAATLSADYRINTGDKLAVTVYRVEDLSREYRVDLAGSLAMPLIGNVQAVGRTTAEVRDEIARRLGERY